MIRTQIQLPDALYEATKRTAARMEISLAELVRRGLEYMLSVSASADDADGGWELPHPRHLGTEDPFSNPDWRADIHTDRLRIAEGHKTDYGGDTTAQ